MSGFARQGVNTPIRQVQRCHVERHAAAAIAQRLGHDVADAVLGTIRARGGAVLLHLNSSGNAAAAESRLRALGYHVEPTDYNSYAPGNYGVKLRVGPAQPLDELWCAGSGTAPAAISLERRAFQTQPRGICSHCGHDMPIRGNGTLRKHQADPGTAVRPRQPARALSRSAQDAGQAVGQCDG